jgi:hypothetical protein
LKGADAPKQGDIVGIDADSQKDLSLQDEDAEGVVGGAKQKKHQAKHKAAPHAANPPMIDIQGAPPGGPVEYVQPPDDCDPDETT